MGVFRSTISDGTPDQVSCATCLGLQLKLCKAAAEANWALPGFQPLLLHQTEHFVPSRRIISRERELSDAVPIICRGWAASVIMLSDGSRQITSFILPGEFVSTSLVHAPRPHFVIEAITDVWYRNFQRSELKVAMMKTPTVMEGVARACVTEKARAEDLIVDLGRRTAEERIARLILNLLERLATRHADYDNRKEIEFPLRQHHIADATGLTSVHVSKVLSAFRRNDLIDISERSLTILDPIGFRRIANMR